MLRPTRRQMPSHVTMGRARIDAMGEVSQDEYQLLAMLATLSQGPTRKLRASRMDNVSTKYVPDEKLHDPPARLFRQLINALNMNPHKWGNYLRDYLDWVVTTEDPQRAKVERMTRQGNIKDTYFQKHTLTFNKLLEGLSILRMQSCKITLEVVDENGEIITAKETIRIVGKKRLSKPLDVDSSPSKE